MQSNNYEWFITQTVQSMLPCFHNPDICLAMKVKMEWTDHGYDENDKKVRDTKSFVKELLLVFHRPNNYTLVLAKDISKEQHFFMDKKEMEMEQLSHHDSCWRSDGMRWVFQTFIEAWDYFDQFGIEGREIDPMFHYDIFRGAPAYYKVEMKRKSSPDGNRWIEPYMVNIGEQVPMCEISKYMPEGKLS